MTRNHCLQRLSAFLPAVFLLLYCGSFSTAALAAKSESRQQTGTCPPATQQPSAFKNSSNSGQLIAQAANGKHLGSCPLKHTDVRVHVCGHVASVDVIQVFQNPFKKKIEAVYVFPLSDSGAVDAMVMRIGNRFVQGKIERRETAREIYEQAKWQGQSSALLDQERPNVFTQSVANIEPGHEIVIAVHYVDLLPFESGAYTFAFPTVVGPRCHASSSQRFHNVRHRPIPLGQHDSSINPLYAPEATRSGHDISMSIDIDAAGLPVCEISSPLHAISVSRFAGNQAHIQLVNQTSIPNRDFVLSWHVSTELVQSSYLTHRSGKSGFLNLMLLPPRRVSRQTAAPKELFFVVDRSGSQAGAPLQKCKETLLYILNQMNPNDSLQIISFADDATKLFDRPKVANPRMREQAAQYIEHMVATGGTSMISAVKEVCSVPADPARLRVVTFMTDGFIDNETEILRFIRQHRNDSRWFSFGTGNSVNRFLIDNIARVGGGEADYVFLNRPGVEVAKTFYDKISSPLLSQINVEFGGLDVCDVLPRQIPDLWAQRPVYILARYNKPGNGIVKLRGVAGGKVYEQVINVTLPDSQPSNSSIAQLWARSAITELMALDWLSGSESMLAERIREQITQLALQFHLMTEYTSFVAVDEAMKTTPGQPAVHEVAVDMPEGVSLSGLFKDGDCAVDQASCSWGSPPVNSLQSSWEYFWRARFHCHPPRPLTWPTLLEEVTCPEHSRSRQVTCIEFIENKSAVLKQSCPQNPIPQCGQPPSYRGYTSKFGPTLSFGQQQLKNRSMAFGTSNSSTRFRGSRGWIWAALGICLNCLTLSVGLFQICKGLCAVRRSRASGVRSIVLGATWLLIGFTYCLALVPWAGWMLWSRLRCKRPHSPGLKGCTSVQSIQRSFVDFEQSQSRAN